MVTRQQTQQVVKPTLDDDEMDALALMLGNPCAVKKITETMPEFRLPDSEHKSSAESM